MNITAAMDLIAHARSEIENLTVEELRDELENDEVVFVDVREPGEREHQGYISRSIHVPRGMLEFCADPTLPAHREELDPSPRILVYCAVGGSSALAAATLKRIGFTDVAHLDGGFDAWRLTGGPIESPRPATPMFTANP